MKKTLSLVLALAIMSSMSTATCFAVDIDAAAEDSSTGPSGSLRARAEVIEEWQASNNEEEELAALEAEPAPAVANATWVNISDFVYYGQQKKDSCGAAAVRMALKGLTGTAPTETAARKGCKWESGVGTYMDNCTAYLNEEQDLYAYDDKYSVLRSLFDNNLYDAIDAGAPPIVGIAITTDDGWYYNTSGHAFTP